MAAERSTAEVIPLGPSPTRTASGRARRIATERRCKTCGLVKPNPEFTMGARGHRQKCNACIASPPVATEQRCLSCGIVKPLSEFHANPKMKLGVKSKCKDCANAYDRESSKSNPRSGMKNRPDKLLRLYGTTYEELQRVLAAQHGRCANLACGTTISLEGPVSKTRAVIDHDHGQGHGHFRGLLCNRCNLVLGTLETQERIILGLMEYLAQRKEI